MKTKEEVKKSRSQGVGESGGSRQPRREAPAAVWNASAGFSTPRLLDLWSSESREQSENVYENKGQVQNVAEQGSADLYLSGHARWVICYDERNSSVPATRHRKRAASRR